jgi:heat shock protein HtpX
VAPAVLAPAVAVDDRRAAERTNRRRAMALCVGFAALPALVLGVIVGVAAGPIPGVAVAVCLGAVVAGMLARRSVSVALSVIGGRPMDDDEDVTLANLVDGLCATVGVARPDLWLVEDPVRNSCVLAAPGRRAVLVVTSGLLESLGLIEMEGVVAHELAHLRRHDAVVSSVAVATAGQVARLIGNDRILHVALGRGREYRADCEAALAVHYPPGLHDALAAMRAGPVPAPGSAFAGRRWSASRWLWIDPMCGVTGPAPAGELDATDVRMDALAEW